MSVPAPDALEVALNSAASRTGVKDTLLRSTLRVQSDEKLVELLREGFAPAFDVMVERYRLPLTRYCARMVGPDNADDVVQDTFTASYSALGSDDRPIQLKPWLYRVAHNTAISALRKKSRHEHEELDENFDGVRQPHDHLEQSQRLHDLVANMRALPERQRAAIVLQELEGMSPEEIADELDGSVPMVRQLVHRARERLRNGVGMLIPLPLILKLFGAETASAATSKSTAATAATTKSAGATFAGVGVTGSGAKLAVVLSVGLLAGGGVAIERVVLSSNTGTPRETSAEQSAASGHASATTAHATAPGRARSGGGSIATATETPGTNDSGPSAGSDRGSSAGESASGPQDEIDRGSTNPSAPSSTDGTAPSSGDSPGSNPTQAPAGEAPPSSGGGSGGGGSQPSGGGGGGSQPSGGGGSKPNKNKKNKPNKNKNNKPNKNDKPSGGGGNKPSGGGGNEPSGGGGTPPSGGGGSKPNGGEGSKPSEGGGSKPNGGEGNKPSGGGGGKPSCKPIKGVPLPLICLGG